MSLPSPYIATPVSRNGNTNYWDYGSWRAEGPTLREYVRVVGRHRLLIGSCFIAALGVMALALVWMTPMYTARSTIMIERQTPEVLDIRQPFAEDEADYTDPDNFYRTQDDILESRSLASRVIVALDLQHNRFFDSEITSRGKRHSTSGAAQGAEGSGDRKVQGPGKSNDAATVTPDTLETYLNNLEIRPKQGTRLVTVEFTSPDPALSARIVNAHIQAYIARGIELRSQASASAVRFLKSRLANLKTNVEQAEAALNKYRRQRGIIAESPNDKATLIIERLSELTKELTDVQAERIDLEAKVHLLTATDYRSLPEVLNQPTVQVLSEELATVDSQYASLASEYKPGYPPLEDLAAKKRKLEGRLNDEMRRIATSINLKYKTAVAREQDLRDEIELEKKNALALNDASLQDSILSRAVDSNRELYKHVLARVNELGMAAAMSDSNVSIVDYAQPPQRHSSPKKPFDLAFAGILGLFLGVVMSFAIEHFDDAIRGPDEVQSVLGLPSLGLVPNFTELSGPGRRVSKYLPGGRVRALEKTEPPRNHELVAGLESLPSAIEAYRAVRLGLMFSRAEKPPTTILVTSACAKEGKTVTAINTGIAFAEMGERVLLLDADLRRPRCHQALGVPNQQGLAEILTGQAAFEHIVRPTHIAGLSCVPAGSSTPNPAALFASKATAALLNCLRRCYDCVLIDSAPILSVTDSLLLAGLVDGVLVVAGPETSRQDVQRACAMLAQARANIFGVVLNRYPTRSSYYRDYYHYFGAPEYSRS